LISRSACSLTFTFSPTPTLTTFALIRLSVTCCPEFVRSSQSKNQEHCHTCHHSPLYEIHIGSFDCPCELAPDAEVIFRRLSAVNDGRLLVVCDPPSKETAEATDESTPKSHSSPVCRTITPYSFRVSVRDLCIFIGRSVGDCEGIFLGRANMTFQF
jgi:hypothetical protein